MQPRDSDLLPGEQLLWAGAPVRYSLFERVDLFLVPFSLTWSGVVFVIYLKIRSWPSSSAMPYPPTLFLLPFLLIAFHMLVGRFVVRFFSLRGTRYAVTDRRLIVRRTFFGRREYTAYLSELSPPNLQERPDGIGTITFGDINVLQEVAKHGIVSGNISPFQLKGIESARQVRDLIASGQETRRSLG